MKIIASNVSGSIDLIDFDYKHRLEYEREKLKWR